MEDHSDDEHPYNDYVHPTKYSPTTPAPAQAMTVQPTDVVASCTYRLISPLTKPIANLTICFRTDGLALDNMIVSFSCPEQRLAHEAFRTIITTSHEVATLWPRIQQVQQAHNQKTQELALVAAQIIQKQEKLERAFEAQNSVLLEPYQKSLALRALIGYIIVYGGDTANEMGLVRLVDFVEMNGAPMVAISLTWMKLLYLFHLHIFKRELLPNFGRFMANLKEQLIKPGGAFPSNDFSRLFPTVRDGRTKPLTWCMPLARVIMFMNFEKTIDDLVYNQEELGAPPDRLLSEVNGGIITMQDGNHADTLKSARLNRLIENPNPDAQLNQWGEPCQLDKIRSATFQNALRSVQIEVFKRQPGPEPLTRTGLYWQERRIPPSSGSPERGASSSSPGGACGSGKDEVADHPARGKGKGKGLLLGKRPAEGGKKPRKQMRVARNCDEVAATPYPTRSGATAQRVLYGGKAPKSMMPNHVEANDDDDAMRQVTQHDPMDVHEAMQPSDDEEMIGHHLRK